MQPIYLTIALAPLAAAIIAGLFGKTIGKVGAHGITILGVGISCVLSFYVLYQILFNGQAPFNGTVYTWLVSDGVSMDVGFLIDRLSAMMMAVVTFVSLMVHIYTIGYMDEDPGYQRFFSYISLFTFSMLMLVMSNNFVAFSRYLGDIGGQIFVFFILTVAAAESAIGLAILVVVFRERRSIEVEDLDTLQG